MRPLPAPASSQPWANGNGRTTELAHGGDGPDWRWRISVARIDAPARFSDLAGTRRQLAPLDAPLALDFDDGTTHGGLRLQTLHFDGAPAPACRLPDGPTRAFNLMLRGDAAGELTARPLLGTMLLHGTGPWFVHALAGTARMQRGDAALHLASGESAWLDAAPGRAVLEGAGEVVLVRFERE